MEDEAALGEEARGVLGQEPEDPRFADTGNCSDPPACLREGTWLRERASVDIGDDHGAVRPGKVADDVECRVNRFPLQVLGHTFPHEDGAALSIEPRIDELASKVVSFKVDRMAPTGFLGEVKTPCSRCTSHRYR